MQGDPVLMVLYSITRAPLVEELCASAPDLLALFYADDAAFYCSSDRSVSLITLLLYQGLYQGCFLDPSKLLFICNYPSH